MKKRIKNNSGKIVGENMRIVEDKIHPDVFSQFYRYLDNSNDKTKSEEVPDIRQWFTELAKTGSIESYRMIESAIYKEGLPMEVRDFARAALNFCRFKIENEILDIPTDMVSGGLGGVDNKMRIFVALAGKDGITKEQFLFIKEAFKKILKERDSILEEVELHNYYVSLLILCSFDYAIGDIIDSGIALCDFLQTDYYATNVEVPMEDRIRDWLDGKLEQGGN